MTSEKIIDILKNGKIHLSCELFPPKQGAELQNSLEIVNKIAASKPSYMSVTYGAGGSTVGYSAALAKKVEDNGMPALAHLTCVKADEAKLAEVLGQLQGFGVKNILALRGDIPADMQGEEIGSFAHASELMRFVKQQGDFCVGGAAYPEGHPESGSLEQDADIVLFINRPEQMKEESPLHNLAKLIVAKHRNGPTNSGIDLVFIEKLAMFRDKAYES